MLYKKKKSSMGALKRSQLIFYCSIVTLPFLWWAFTFSYHNLRTILYWFQAFDATTGEYYFVGLNTLKQVGNDFLHAA